MMQTADTIILGGTVVPVTGPAAQAVAIRGERIAAVGPREEILRWRRNGTEVVDLRGAALLPGLIEPHTHPDLCSQMYSWVDVSGFNNPTEAQVEEKLREAIRTAKSGEWVFAFGLDPMITSDLGRWDRDRLDALAPENPVLVMIQSMHSVIVNSLALSAAGVDEKTSNLPRGGRFLKDADGRLTGEAVEQGALLKFLGFFDQSAQAFRSRLADQYLSYQRAGITMIGVAGLSLVPDPPHPLWSVFEEVTLGQSVRVVNYLHEGSAQLNTRCPSDGSDRLRLQGVKYWYDGSPYSGTMLLDEPYLESELCIDRLGIQPGSRGKANYDPSSLVDDLSHLHSQGWQVITHAQGDRGTSEILDLYEKVLSASDRSDHRWRLEHCVLISRDDLARAARLGVNLSFHVNHVYYYGPELRDDIIGPARAEGCLLPLASALRAGHRISLHADSPMYPVEPLKLMQTAITRRTRTGEQLGAAEAITAEQALRAVTIDAAWHLFADHLVGSIEPGKYADFTVLERNPLEVPPEEIDRIGVLGTWSGGRPAETLREAATAVRS